MSFYEKIPPCPRCGSQEGTGVYVGDKLIHIDRRCDCKKKAYERGVRKRDLILFGIGFIYPGVGYLITKEKSYEDALLFIAIIFLMWLSKNLIFKKNV